jgi:hypothetical protein
MRHPLAQPTRLLLVAAVLVVLPALKVLTAILQQGLP